MARIITFLLALSLSTVTFSQIVINEISTAQTAGLIDEDGDYPDWIELYNAGSVAVNLEGYALVSENEAKQSWVFPTVYIQPNDHLIVFASEKDRRDIIDHWEIPIFPEVVWNYYTGPTTPPSNWNTQAFNPAAWSLGMGGIGYGDGDDSTIIAQTTTLYMRSEFILTDTSNISIGLLAIDYDDSFVAYLNGVELTRNNIGVQGTQPVFSDLAYEEREAKLYAGGGLEFLFFDLALMNSAKNQGNNVFSVEVHNDIPLSDDMSSIPYLLIGVKDTSVTFFQFPASTNLHTNFNLSSFPTELKLFDPSNNLIDQLSVIGTRLNNSYGRTSDGASNWCIFDIPTADTSNILSNCFTGYAQQPNISLPAGFYTGSQSVSITTTQAGSIFYSTDGSIPTPSSALYSGPIIVASNSVIKAVLYPSNLSYLPSKTTVASYYINENVSLPVISISTDPINLWDYNEGIYVFGPTADSINYPFQGSNFWKNWEKECNVEFFDRNKQLAFSQNAGLKIHGNFSKAWPQKSFRILAKDDYNEKWINYELFPDKPGRQRYKNFNVRNAGIDYNTVHFRDALMHEIAKGLHLDYMAYEPCVLFLNGQYWGVYGLRERQDDSYIEENHPNVSKENIDLLRFEGDALSGTNEGFKSMINYLQATDLSVQSNFDYVESDLLDIKNVTDYFITETFYSNIDWLSQTSSNNVKYWRENSPEGKWRYVLWDTDLGLGLIDGQNLLNYNYLADIIGPTYTGVHSTLLKSLLTNVDYANDFVNRYADLMNTTFHPVNVNKIGREMEADLEPEMSRHFTKWNEGVINIFGYDIARSLNLTEWKLNIDSMLMWADQRPQIVRDHIQGMIASPNQVDITLAVYPEDAGYIKINTITPDSLPWTGRYFNGVPVTITAVANPGYSFEYWESSNGTVSDSLANSFTENVAMDETFTARFDKLAFDVLVYPNPSDDTFTINYELEKDTQLSIQLIGVDGKLIRILNNGEKLHAEGKYSFSINKSEYNLSSGIHFLRFESSDFTKVVKLSVL